MLNKTLKTSLLPAAALSAVAGAALLTACGGGGSDSGTQTVSVEFVATVGDTVVNCGSDITGLGTTSAKVKLQDLRFYIANLKLINDKSEEVKVTLDANSNQLTSGDNTVALVDLEDQSGWCAGDKALYTTITGTVPKGTYTGVKATLGVPEALNHSETTVAAAPLDNKDMAWSWQAGRKFVKIEVNPYNASTATYANAIAKYSGTTPLGTTNSSFYFHLGNTGCTAVAGAAAGTYTCSSDNTRTFHIHSFDAAKQRIAVDLKQLFVKSNLVEEHGGAGGCMSGPTDPECVAMWSVIGSSFDSSGNSVQDSSNAFFHGETIFRPVSK